MRLFSGLFMLLAAQALLFVALLTAILILTLSANYADLALERDSERLASVAREIAPILASGAPAARALEALPGSDPSDIRHRVAIVSPSGAILAGPKSDADAPALSADIAANGRSIGRLKLVRWPGPTSPDMAALRFRILTVVVIMAVTLAVMLFVAWIIASRWSRPQRQLYALSKAVAEGDYAAEIVETGPLETKATMRNIGRVARSFDRLETARRTWLVAVAEEIHRPVDTIAARLKTLHDAGVPVTIDALEDIGDDVARLIDMANDLQAVALADLGRLPVTFATVDPCALIHNAVWINKRRAQIGQVTLEAGRLPSTTVPVKWDGARIEQLFSALIENSLRYTPPGGRIELGLEQTRNAWRLIIDDSAPGVDIDLAQRLFEPFYRTTTVPGESVTSSGLGLATAQAIVEAHHGRIDAGSSPLGGLRVAVILPTVPPMA